MSDVAIQVQNLGKRYKLYEKPTDLLFDILKIKKNHKEFWALQDINFSIKKGEVVGVLGVNGAGKSTLLKILSGKLEKTTGSFAIKGQISSILELGTGFHPHYTGRENIVMGAMCLGLGKQEAEERAEWIIDFSGLAEVIDQPFNTYSSGMQARLTFATAVSIDPDIFIVDEALATGDAFFAQKCIKRIREICQNGTTALFVSHATHAIVQLCQRAIWIDKGRIRMDGPALDVVRAYEYHGHQQINALTSNKIVEVEVEEEKICFAAQHEVVSQEPSTKKVKTVYRKGPFKIDKVELLNSKAEATAQFYFWDSLRVRVTYSCPEDCDLEPVGLAAALNRQSDFLPVMTFNTNLLHSDQEATNYFEQDLRKAGYQCGVIEADITPLQVTPGHYFLSLGILKNCPNSVDFFEYRHYFYEIVILRSGFPESGIFYPMVKWTHEPVSDPQKIREEVYE